VTDIAPPQPTLLLHVARRTAELGRIEMMRDATQCGNLVAAHLYPLNASCARRHRIPCLVNVRSALVDT